MTKKKCYVVWKGLNPGIYHSWNECKAQVFGFEGALYKSFSSLEEAEKAFSQNAWKSIASKSAQSKKSLKSSPSKKKIIQQSLAVDAACSGNPGQMEYRGVFVADGKEIFHIGPMQEGTNNIGEFLAIVHALALLKKKSSAIPIYSDSATAIAWINKKKCNSKLEKTSANEPIFELIQRAEAWLLTNSYTNPIIKWETSKWGEIPADFGRK